MWLLSNFGVITFYWTSLWRFWPVFLIIIGVNLLVPKEGIGNLISVAVTLIALVFVGYQSSKPSPGWLKTGISWREDDETDWNDDDTVNDEEGRVSNAVYNTPYESQIKEADLEIHGGAVEYKIEGETDELFHAETKSTFGRHILESSHADSTAKLSFRMKKFKQKNWDLDNDENSARIALNTVPLWKIKLEMGAGAAEFDLSKYRVKRLDMKGGAASFEVKMGMPVQESIIYAESGVASVEIQVPKAAACQITVDSGLSSKEFSGFDKQSDGSYTTANYEQAGNRYSIHLKGGLSSFSVSRY